MAMTAAVKDELSRLSVTRPCCRKAEISALLRFAGGLHLVGPADGRPGPTRIVVEAELDTGSTARRLRKELAEVYGHASDVHVVAAGGLRKGNRYVVRVSKDGEGLARQAGLVDGNGRPVRGLPAAGRERRHVRRRGGLARGVPRARLAHRARPLLLARDHLSRARGRARPRRRGPAPRGRRQGPGGARRRPRRRARRRRHQRAAHPLGAHEAVLAWEDRRMRREVRATANRLANFDDANLRARPGRPSPPAPGSSARSRSSARTPRTTCSSPAACAASTPTPRWRSSARWPTRR
jgi:hypothetical protein